MTVRRLAALAAAPLAWRSLAVAAAALAAVAQLALPVRVPVSALAAAYPPAALPPVASQPREPASYPAIAEHPLFSPTREPYVPPPPAPPPPAAEGSALRDYLLLGTIVDGNTRIALLKPPDSRKTIRAVEGQVIAGWMLREITPDALEFENGAAHFALHFPHPRWPHP